MKRAVALAVALLPIALAAMGSMASIAACDTPPSSPVNASGPVIAPAHPSPDPPPNRPVIVEDAGSGDAGRVDLGAPDGGAGLGDMDGGRG